MEPNSGRVRTGHDKERGDRPRRRRIDLLNPAPEPGREDPENLPLSACSCDGDCGTDTDVDVSLCGVYG